MNGDRGRNGSTNEMRDMDVRVGKEAINRSTVIKFSVLNRSLVKVEPQMTNLRDRKRGLGNLLLDQCDNDREIC